MKGHTICYPNSTMKFFPTVRQPYCCREIHRPLFAASSAKQCLNFAAIRLSDRRKELHCWIGIAYCVPFHKLKVSGVSVQVSGSITSTPWHALILKICLDRITGLTGFFCLAGHYPVDPVDPVNKINKQNTLFDFRLFRTSLNLSKRILSRK